MDDPPPFQGMSMACYPFALTAVTEVLARNAAGNPSLDGLSEADLLFGSGGNCWVPTVDPDVLLKHLATRGILARKQRTWEGFNPPSGEPARDGPRTQASRFARILVLVEEDFAFVKWWLARCGPLVAVIRPRLDFLLYQGGAYRPLQEVAPTENVQMQDHAVVLVGYDDGAQEWLLRNSWGRNWGEPAPGSSTHWNGGYFRLPYGTEILDSEFVGVNGFRTIAGKEFDPAPYFYRDVIA